MDTLTALAHFDGKYVAARDVAALMDGTTPKEAGQNGRSTIVGREMRRFVRDGLATKDYGPRSCLYAITGKGKANLS